MHFGREGKNQHKINMERAHKGLNLLVHGDCFSSTLQVNTEERTGPESGTNRYCRESEVGEEAET